MARMNIFDMMQDRAKVTDSIRKLMDKYDDTTKMTAEDRQELERLEAEFDNLNQRITDEQRQQERERAIGEQQQQNGPKDNKPSLFARALSGRADDIAAYRNSMSLGNDDQAGALTAPMEFRQELIKELDNMLFMRKICRVIPGVGAGQSLGFPYRKSAAVIPSWTGEVDEAPEETTVSYGRREFKPYRIADLLKISRTLMNHAPMAERILKEEIAGRLGAAQEVAYLTGDGNEKPLGVFTASENGIPTSRDFSAGNTATELTTDGLMEAKYALKQQYQGGAQWIFHRDAVKMLAKLKDGNDQYVWFPSVRDDQPDRLLGKTVNMSEYAPNTFTTGQYVGIYGNFKNYWIADADALTIQVLNEVYARNNQTGYLWNFFGDGMPVIGEAFARVTLG